MIHCQNFVHASDILLRAITRKSARDECLEMVSVYGHGRGRVGNGGKKRNLFGRRSERDKRISRSYREHNMAVKAVLFYGIAIVWV